MYIYIYIFIYTIQLVDIIVISALCVLMLNSKLYFHQFRINMFSPFDDPNHLRISGRGLGAAGTKGNLQRQRASHAKHTTSTLVDRSCAPTFLNAGSMPCLFGTFLIKVRAGISFGRASSKSIAQRTLGWLNIPLFEFQLSQKHV